MINFFPSSRPFFEWCGRTAVGMAVRDTIWAFPFIETFHLLALAALLGSILLINLRVFGIGMRQFSVPQLARMLEPWILASIPVMLVSGILMALSEPIKCFESYSFPVKMLFLGIAIVYHFTVQRKLQISEDAPPIRGRLGATLGISLWAIVSIAGRGIPYI
jgi:hypothetical protein